VSVELHWLIYILVENNIVSQEDCLAVLEELGDDVDTASYAQKVFDSVTCNMDEESAGILLGSFEEALALADDMAQKGEEIPEFSEVETSSEEVESNKPGSGKNSDVANYLRSMLETSLEQGASDLHISTTAPPFIRKSLEIKKLDEDLLTPEDSYKLNTVFLTEEQKKIFDKKKDLTYPLSIGESRFRVTLMQHKDGVAGTYHLIPNKARELKELGFSNNAIETIEKFLDFHNGLILLTGPVGAGKTTTLASLVNTLNVKRKDHIITVEDPIEIVQNSINCNVTQREVSTHTQSYSAAIKGALREDPDIIVIGELKDFATTEIAITAAETGHLVIATLPTCDAINTLSRVVNVFPPSQQPQVRTMVAGSLRGIICQRLLPNIDGGVVVACEILVNNVAVSNNVGDGKFYLLKPAMQVGKKAGMCIMDDYIYELFRDGVISEKVALDSLINKKQYEKMISSSKL
jgi:twitching motility protein PilT